MPSGDVIVGVGEIGKPLWELLSRTLRVQGVDIIPERCCGEHLEPPIEILHFCIPCTDDFVDIAVRSVADWRPKEVVIHSTVKPHTTERMQDLIDVPVIYSPVRGVHSRMLTDLQRYDKFYSSLRLGEVKEYPVRLRQIGLRGKVISNPLTLEYAKILVDTTYYGWLIIFAQHTKKICDRENIDYDEMWKYGDEINALLGNRPKMYPGEGIGGHCILPNVQFLGDEFLSTVFSHDRHYREYLASRRAKNKGA